MQRKFDDFIMSQVIDKYNHIDSGELVKEIERLIVICNEANND